MHSVAFTQADWAVDSQGFWVRFLVSNPVKAKESVEKIRQSDKPHEIEIKEIKRKRSLDANAYFWVLCDKLAQKTRIPKVEIYREAIRNIGGNNSVICVRNFEVDKLRATWERNGLGWQTDTMPSKTEGCTNVILYYGSSTYNTEQMSRLIDNIVQDCKEQGIETMTPAELTLLKEAWK